MFRSSVLAIFLCGCAHLMPATPPPISPEATNFFARADGEENAASLVVDVDALRALGFLKPVAPGQHSVWSDIVAYSLPMIAGELRNEPEGALLARSAVLFALFREWEEWPR